MSTKEATKKNFYTCIRGTESLKTEWPMQSHDMAAQFIHLMPTINWFSSEPNSTYLKRAITELQDFCPILGSRVHNGKICSASAHEIYDHQMKYVLDTSSTENQQETLCSGVGYAEILDLDDDAVEQFLYHQDMQSRLGFGDKLDEAFLAAITSELNSIEQSNANDIKSSQYIQNLRTTTKFPRTALLSIDNPTAPVWSVIKLGSKNKKHWAIMTLCNHCLFDGYGMFAVQKHLAKAYFDPNYLHDNFLRITSPSSETSPHSFYIGSQLENNVLSQTSSNKKTMFSTDFSRFLDRHQYAINEQMKSQEKHRIISHNKTSKNNTKNSVKTCISTEENHFASQVASTVDAVLIRVQPYIVKAYWNSAAISWAKDLLKHHTEEELKAGISALARTLVLGDGKEDQYGISKFPKVQSAVINELIENRNFEEIVIETFGINKSKKDDSTNISFKTEKIYLFSMTDKDVEKIKTHYRIKMKNTSVDTEKMPWISTHDALMQFLVPKRMTAWGQVVGIRALSENIRYGVPSNVLGNACDIIGHLSNNEKKDNKTTKEKNNTNYRPNKKQLFHFPTPLRALFNCNGLRQLLLNYQKSNNSQTDSWTKYTINPSMIMDKQRIDIILNSWTKYSGDAWYPWEFGGATTNNFILQSHLPHLKEWLIPPDCLIDEEPVIPFRQALIHKCSPTLYQACLTGITDAEKKALIQRLTTVCGLSLTEAEQRFF